MTVVLLHGFTGGPASFAPLALADAVAPPLLGHGAPPPWPEDFAGEVARIAAALPRGCHLVGYSMGARVALGVLATHPGLVARATLIGVRPGLPSERERAARRARDARWIDLLERDGIDAFVAAWEAQPMWASQRGLPAAARAAQRALRRSHDPHGLAAALRALGLGAMPDYTPFLPAIDVPVHLVAGELDATFARIARAMARRMPNARVTIVPNCGHNPVLEAPAAVATVIQPRSSDDRDQLESRTGI
ncbi:MAG: alpha/beta fold hydrolase [Deltaproteobacteria bacterium]|nr:MAG: alpha/beta fold hydrolase [Deltaproteobacteria bacterium]